MTKSVRWVRDTYVNSLGQHFVGLGFDWDGRPRDGQYCLISDSIIMQPRKRGGRVTEITKYPKYLKLDMMARIYAKMMRGEMRFFEYDRDGNQRYTGLRYHDADGYYGLHRIIAGMLHDLAPGRLVDIFNDTTPLGTVMMTTSADGDRVQITNPARMQLGTAKTYVLRLDDYGHHDTWLLKFIAPLYKEQGESTHA